MVDHTSDKSAAGEVAGGPWQVRDFLSFVQKTHHEREANVSQTCPIMSFAQNWLGTCRADTDPDATGPALANVAEIHVMQRAGRSGTSSQT